LSYYIYNNIYLVEDSFINEELLDFIKNEIKEERLASNLITLMQKHSPLSELLSCILKYVDYYTEDDILKLKGIVDSLASKNIVERIGAKADNLLQNNCCQMALYNYDQIITRPKEPNMPPSFYARMFYNMGVAFAKLFYFEKAHRCFVKAYEIQEDSEILKAAYLASMMHENQTGVLLSEIPEDSKNILLHEVENFMNEALLDEDYVNLENVFSMESDGRVSEFYDEVGKIVYNLEMSYKKML